MKRTPVLTIWFVTIMISSLIGCGGGGSGSNVTSLPKVPTLPGLSPNQPPASPAARYAIYDLNPGNIGTIAGFSYGLAINASHRVVGTSNQAAFVWSQSEGLIYIPQQYWELVGNQTITLSGINSSNQAIGYSDNWLGIGNYGFVRQADGTMLTLADANINNGAFGVSAPRAINDAGQIVGGVYYWASPTASPQLLTSLSSDNDLYSYAINASGQIVGASIIRDQQYGALHYHAVLWPTAASIPQGLGALPGDTDSTALAINTAGQVIGWSSSIDVHSSTTPVFHPFLWSASSGMRNIGTLPSAPSAVAYGINTQGQVVGASGSKPFSYGATPAGSGDLHAFLWTSTEGMKDLNTLIAPRSGWVLYTANGINDAGEIVGTGTINGNIHAYLLTPLP